MSYLLYNFLLVMAFAAALPLLPFIWLLGARYREGLGQRFAFYPGSLGLSSDPIWIHAASVGEVRAAVALVRALKLEAPERTIVVSTFTATGNRVARDSAQADKIIFLPLDFPWTVRRALAQIHPRLLIFLETEIWPNLVREAYRRGIPIVMLSGRLSAKALSRYQVWRPLFRCVLEHYTAIGMQSAEDAARVLTLGAAKDRVSVVGSLKFAADGSPHRKTNVPRHDPNRFLFVAGSSHQGEEEILLSALVRVRSNYPNVSMVLAPRHPERFSEVEKLLKKSRFSFQRRSEVTPKEFFKKDILLLDTIGELPEFFEAGDIAWVGGSLVDAGGHNVLEPARYEKPVLFGPYMSNFKGIAEALKEQGAAIEVTGADDLAQVLSGLLGNPEARARMGRIGAQFAKANHESLTRNLDLAKRYL